jgi:hypothetical protein
MTRPLIMNGFQIADPLLALSTFRGRRVRPYPFRVKAPLKGFIFSAAEETPASGASLWRSH